MSKRWLTIIVLVSLAFNVAVLGMFIYMTAFHRPPFPPSMEKGRLDGPPPKGTHGQSKWMMDCMKDGMESCRPAKEKFQAERMGFIQTLKADKFDETAAKAALEKSLTAHSDMERKLGTNLIEMRKKMTSAEAKQFFDKSFEHRKEFKNKMKNHSRRPQ